MTDTSSLDDGRDFEEALTDLIEMAHMNGTDVKGGWKCAIDGNGDYYFDVQITTVEYDSD